MARKNAPLGMTVAAFAREVDVTPQAVRARIKSGRLADAVLEDGSLDAEQARVLWIRNHAVSMVRGPNRSRTAEAAEAAGGEYALKVERMRVALETERITLEKLRATTIDRDVAKRATRALVRTMRDAVLNFPARQGSQIAAEVGCDARKLIGLMEAGLREALTDWADNATPFDDEGTS